MSELIEKYSNKSLSTRLKGDNLEFFLKYARHKRSTSVSETFNLLIEDMQGHLDLSEMEVPESLFGRKEQKAVNQMFLARKDRPKISLEDVAKAHENIEIIPVGDAPKHEPEPKEEPKEDNDNDDDVIYI